MKKRIVVAGGGAAGVFGAIACAENAAEAEVVLLEKGAELLQKVRISGGGRCNVTHACFEARELTRSYPRGEKELIGPYHQFQAEDTVRWFESRGVKLKTEADGRMFPITDSSDTIIKCLLREAHRLGVTIKTNATVSSVTRQGDQFLIQAGETILSDGLLLATGGCRTPALGQLAVSLGHQLVPPVPSLFTFQIAVPWVRALAGISVPAVELTIAAAKPNSRGALLFTHWGLSGPAVLRLSAWEARALHDAAYTFPLSINWVPDLKPDAVRNQLEEHARSQAAKAIGNAAFRAFPQRLWHALIDLASVPREKRWSTVSRAEQQRLGTVLTATELPVTGKSLNKDEFVTCGGVALPEVNFKTMESKICPGLYFAGELLDIDGITGGFNFQAAWTTGWIAGRSLATRVR